MAEPTLSGSTIGVIGLGLMGWPMALNLVKAGASVVVWNRSQAALDNARGAGMQAAKSPKAVATASDITIVMVADTPALQSVMLGDDGALAGVKSGAVIIDMGTSAVGVTRELAELAVARGAHYVDAPVSGGTIGAEAATLSIMAGGPAAAIDLALPTLRALGKNIVHVGDTGCGQIAKAANQMIVGLTIGAVAEALSLATRAGADPAKVREALMGGFADSRILQVHGERMINATFAPGGKVTTQRKDMDQAIALAASIGMDLPASELNRDLYDRLIELGGGDLDHSALIKVYETEQ